MSVDTAMIFCAGFGTRMGDLTKSQPKPLIEVAGKPLVDHAIDLATAAGIRNLAANTHYKADQMADHLSRRNVISFHEFPEILETGGGLKNATLTLGNSPLFTINPDVIWAGPNPLTLLSQAWDPQTMDALLMCVPVARASCLVGQGDFQRDVDGRVSRGQGLVYGGVQIINPAGLADIDGSSFSLNLLWDRMLSAGRLSILEYPGHWCDIGRPEGIAAAEDLLKGLHV